MTKLLLKLFVPGYADGTKNDVRTAVGKLSGTVGILCNVLLFGFKIAVGILSGSVAITADAMNNLSDAVSSVVTLLGFKLAEKPADEDHPYGHARFEYLSGLAVAAIIVVIGFELAKTSVERIFTPAEMTLSLALFLVLAGSILVKLWLCLFNRKLGKHIRSTALLATAADSRNDTVATSAVLLAALLQKAFGWQLDGIMGLLVALFILYSGAMLGKETISPLLGETASPELQELILSVIRGESMVLGYHDLLVHDYGPGQRFASIHVEMDRREDPLLCHERIDELERRCLYQHNVHLVIHYDPVVVGDPETDRLRELVRDILKRFDERITIHDFRIVAGENNTNLIFDAALPVRRMGESRHVKAFLDEELNKLGEKQYFTVITFDMETGNT